MHHMRTLSLLGIVLGISGLATVASAETVSTTDGVMTVIESVAPLGTPLSYVSGGNGLVGIGAAWPVGGTPAQAMNNYDHMWLQYPDVITMTSATPLNQVFAIPGTDHDPFPYENLEFRIWGKDTISGAEEEGRIVAIYRDGFDTANTFNGHSDDYTSLWQFRRSYTTFVITGGTHLLPADFNRFTEGEIDGLAASRAPVPEPSSVVLLASGIMGLALRSRKRVK